MTTPQPSAPLAADAAPTPETRPRIYVACLAAYNNGCLHGRWIDATTPDEVMAEVCAMLAASPLPDAVVPPFTVLSGSPGVQVEQLPESAEITLREQAYAAVERRQRE